MHASQIPYLGWQELPADLSAVEIEHFTTQRAEERRAVGSRYRLAFWRCAADGRTLPSLFRRHY